MADYLMTVANSLLHLLRAHGVRWRICPVPAQELLQRLRPVAVVDLANRETAPTRVQAGVGIGAVLEQQLRDFQVIRTASLEQRSAVGSQVFRLIRIGAVFEQQSNNVQMAFPRRVG